MSHSAEKDTLLAALNAHAGYWQRRAEDEPDRWEALCSCGEVLTDTSNGPFFDQRHRAHQATVLARVLSIRKNEGLKCPECGQPVVHTSEHLKMGPVWKCPVAPEKTQEES